MRDPYWLTAKFASTCGKPGCTVSIKKGDRAFYYPNTRTILASPCGHADEASRDFDSHAQDDANNSCL